MRGIGILFKCGMRNSECGISGGEAMLRIVKNRVLFIHCLGNGDKDGSALVAPYFFLIFH